MLNTADVVRVSALTVRESERATLSRGLTERRPFMRLVCVGQLGTYVGA